MDRGLSLIENTVAAATLGCASLIIMVQVFMRYVLNSPLAWSEEAAVYLLIYSSFIGAVITLRHNEHVGVDILAAALGQRANWVLTIISSALVVLYCVVVGAIAWVMIFSPASQNTRLDTLNIPVWCTQLALSIGLTLMLVRGLEILYRTGRRRQTFPEAESGRISEMMDSQSEMNDER